MEYLSEKKSSSDSSIEDYKPVDLESDDFNTYQTLERLGNDYLKYELKRRGLKLGGTIEEKAKRLFSVKGLQDKDIPKKLKIVTN